MSVAAEHLEMAAKVFTDINYPIDGILCERFAEVLARESHGRSVLLRDNLLLRRQIVALTIEPATPAVPKVLTIEEEVAKL